MTKVGAPGRDLSW